MSMIGQCNIQDQREYLQLLSNYVRTAVMKICTVHVLVYRFLALMSMQYTCTVCFITINHIPT